MDSFIRSLDEKRLNNWSEMTAILDGAEAEGRDLTAEESERWDKLNADITGIDDRKKKIAEAQARTAVADSVREEHAAVLTPKTDSRSDFEKLGQLFRGEIRSFESGPERRALTTVGGSAIATTFYDQVMVYERLLNPILSVATVLNTTDGAPITFPRLTTDVNTGGTVTAEAGTITAADPTIGSVNLGAFKYASITLWSRELDEDNVIGLADLVARSVARDLSLNYGAHLTTGGGTTVPWGIVTRAGNGGTASGTASGTSSDTFFSPADVIDLMFSVAEPYRRTGTFIVSTTALQKMRKFRDSSGMFMYGIGAPGQPDTFLGRGVVESPAMAAVASASKSILFGDISRYYVRRTPLRVEVSDQYGYATDQLAIKTVVRLDGDLIDTAAVKYLVSANT